MKRFLKDVTITHVSYVKKGQNKKKFFFAKSEENRAADIEFDVRFIRKSMDDEQKLLYGIVYEPDVADHSGDAMTAVEIEKSAHEFLEFYRNIDTEHNVVPGAGVVVESYIAPIDMKIGDEVIKSGSWILVTKATDEIWEDWKNGEITGYSMFGFARATEVSKGEPKLKNMFKKALEAIGIQKSFDETIQNTIENMARSPFFIMDMISKDFYNSVSFETMKDDELKILAQTLRDAADYTETKIVSPVSKSEDGEEKQPEVPAEPEKHAEEIPPEPIEKSEPEEPAKTTTEEKPAEESPIEIIQKSLNDTLEKSVAGILENVMAAINEKLAPISKSIDDIVSKNNELQEKIEVIETGSSVIVTKSVVEPIVSKPANGASLLS